MSPNARLKAAGNVVIAASTWGEKRSKPMNTLNWEKLPTFKANKTIWGQGGSSATSSLQALLGEGKTLQLDVTALEGMFAKPETKVRTAKAIDDRPKLSKVTLLDAKRSTSVGIVMKRITDGLAGKELRDALIEVDENALPTDVLPMVVEILPTQEERKVRTVGALPASHALSSAAICPSRLPSAPPTQCPLLLPPATCAAASVATRLTIAIGWLSCAWRADTAGLWR